MRLVLGVLAGAAAGCLSVTAAAQGLGITAPPASQQSGGGEQRQDAQEPQPQARDTGPTEQAPPPARESQGEHRNRAENDPGKEGREARPLAAREGIWSRLVASVEGNDKFLVASGALVTAAFTAVLGFATAALWWATRNLVLGAESTAERQLRAYVGASRVYFRSFVPDAPISVAVEIKNFGATPAHDCRIGLWLEVSGHPVPWPGAFVERDTAAKGRAGSLMPGGQSFVVCELPQGLPAQTLAAIRAETSALYLCGAIRYRDVFGEGQQTDVRMLSLGRRSETEFPFIDAPEGNKST